ncbi:CHAT domain-containing protein [Marinoscillum sp.]|uniref:CHAT domain-containing protein n=1 Tax=Marinoscillum sp. TaxID=2024838 RepID=UPI003BA891CE
MLLRFLFAGALSTLLMIPSFGQFGNLGKKLKEKATDVVKDKLIEKTDEKQDEYDTTSFNYAIAFLDKTESFQNRQEGERLVKAAGFVLKDDQEKSDKEKARDLYELGRLSYSKRGYYLGEVYLNAAKLAYEALNEDSDPVYLKTLGSLGLLYSDMGRFDRAEELTAAAMEGWQEHYGESSAGYAAEYSNLAVLAFNQGQLTAAEQKLTRALQLILEVEGKSSIPYAIALNNLGILFQYMGRFDDALNHVNQCLGIAEEELREKSGTYVQFLTNKALIQQESGDYAGAEKTYNEALDNQTSRLKLNRKSDPDYAHMLNNLASLYMVSGRTSEAKELLEQSLQIYQSKFGDEHLLTATAQSDLGKVYLYEGNLEGASNLLEAAYTTKVSKLGAEHPKAVEAKESLAVLAWQTGRYELAEQYFSEVLESSLGFINEFFPSLSEVEKTRYWSQLKPRFFTFYNFAIDQAADHPELVEQMLNYRIKTKGLLLNASTKIRSTILSSGDQDLIDLYEQWQDQKRMLSTYYSFTKEEISEQKVNIDSLENAANLSERQLSQQSSEFSSTFVSDDVNAKSIYAALEQDEALVEIIQYPVFEGALTSDHAYVAIYVNQQGAQLIDLPNSKEFDARSFKLYSNLIKQKLADDYSYATFWEPVAAYTTGISRIYLSPDGAYNQINVNTLQSPQGQFVLDQHDLTYIGNPKDLVSSSASREHKQAFLLGFPSYGSSDIVPLPGTKKEVDLINTTLKSGGYQTNVYTQTQASEKAIKTVRNPGIIHIATHGFFLENREANNKVFGVQVDYANDNPLLRSGLMLAGASADESEQSFEGADNGILTAYEAITLPINETSLVVLSACETGKGEIQSGEGVYGLQRAFMVAGADAMIMSLWKVDDEATQQLMSSFYANMMVKKQQLDVAFRNAQLAVKKSYEHPNYWGAFVLVE